MTTPMIRQGTNSGSVKPVPAIASLAAQPSAIETLTASSARMIATWVIGSWSASSWAMPTVSSSVGRSGVRLRRSIRKAATGPPITAAAIRPSVAAATPSSIAPASSWVAAISGAQAMAVPCPPISDAEPRSTPAPDGSPNRAAPATPTAF